MEIIYTKSFWEMDLAAYQDPMAAFVSRVAVDGFDGTEMFLPLVVEEPAKVLGLLDEHGLRRPVIDIITAGDTPDEHRRSFDEGLDGALRYEPILVNSHTGRDIFSFAENLDLFRHAIERSADAGVQVVHETHRYRPTYSAVETRRYLEELPELLLNADLSHWMVVHESDLADQPGNVDLALVRSRHIHARVGFEEGPQVNDPRLVQWTDHVDRHIALWQRIVDNCRCIGWDLLAITPEFGPAPYAQTAPDTGEPVVDVWDVNVFMKDLLRRRLV